MFEIFIAAIAGLVSFLSPCVLPLVPAYIGYMGGRVTNTVAAQVEVGAGGTAAAHQGPSRLSMMTHSVAFVLGFTVVFVAFGVAASALIFLLEGILIRIGGILIIIFGLHFAGVIPRLFNWMRRNNAVIANPLFTVFVGLLVTAALVWGFTGTLNVAALGAELGATWDRLLLRQGPSAEQWPLLIGLTLSIVFLMWLFLSRGFTEPENFWTDTLDTLDYMFYADTRREMTAEGDKGLLGSFSMGLVFSAGWTPCVGPTLGAALGLAASGDAMVAATRMTAFSLGLGIPFILAALMMDSAQGQLRKLNRHMNKIKVFTGGLLIFIGVLMASGQLQNMSASLNSTFGDLSIRMEHCVVGVFRDDIALSQTGTCLNGDVPFELLKAEHTGETLSAAQIRQINRANGDLDLTQYLDEAVVMAALNENNENSSAQSGSESEVDAMEAGSIEDAAEGAESASGSDEAEAREVGLNVGNQIPDFTTTTLDGEEVSLSDYRGQTVLLNFWYTTCPPCEIEMPDLQAAYEEFQDEGFTILAVNREEGPEAMGDFKDEHELTFPLLLDQDGEIQRQFNVRTYPTSFLVGPDGEILERHFSILTTGQIEEWVDSAVS